MQITDNEEIYYSMALTRLSGVNHAVALQLYKEHSEEIANDGTCSPWHGDYGIQKDWR